MNSNTTTNQTSKEYLLLFRGDDWYNHLSAEELQKVMNEFQTWFERFNAKGIVKAAQPLLREGKIVSGKQGRVVADGPFAESKEAIGGFFLLAVDSLDAAIGIAKTCPGLELGMQIEVRPIAVECPAMARAQQLAKQQEFETVTA